MNLLNIFRKPYLSLILAMVVLFTSCTQGDSIITENNVPLELTIRKHIILSKQLQKIYLNQKHQTVDLSKKIPQFYTNKESFKKFLINNNFTDINKILTVSEDISNNLNSYLSSIKAGELMTETEVSEVLITEIRKQQQIKKETQNSIDRSCMSALDNALENCGENYASSLVLVIVSGFISFGITTIIGYAGATAIMVKCCDDAAIAYEDCIN